MFEQLNLYLFAELNAHAGLSGWQLFTALFAAKWLIAVVPVTLVLLWMSGNARHREAAVRASLAALAALAVNAIVALLWFHPRPFVTGIGHTFMHHAPDSSFPSDHATIMLTVALAFASSQSGLARRVGAALLPVCAVVAWSRVFLGVHYPMDMIGALAVAAGMAMLANTRAALGLSATLVALMESLYRRVLAMPIARGWLRP